MPGFETYMGSSSMQEINRLSGVDLKKNSLNPVRNLVHHVIKLMESVLNSGMRHHWVMGLILIPIPGPVMHRGGYTNHMKADSIHIAWQKNVADKSREIVVDWKRL